MSVIEEIESRAREWAEANTERRVDRMSPPTPNVRDLTDEQLALARIRQRSLFDAGLAGVTWPEEFGGRGLGVPAQRAFERGVDGFELGLDLYDVAVDLAGPTLIAHGTSEQKRRYLRGILTGDDVWCQLFSEPSAGSDLASLRTRAELRDDGWHITGQKVWTSGGTHADLAILVARSDFSASKHAGLTYFVLDMRSEGVTVQPLRQMTGDSHFAEVFLDDVILPVENVVGAVGAGWTVVRTTLSNERVAIGGDPGIEAEQLIALAGVAGPAPTDGLLDEIVRLHVRDRALKALARRATSRADLGSAPGPEASIFKLEYADLQRVGNELGLRILGPDGLATGAATTARGTWQTNLLTSPFLRIAGGTDEIQRNIIAERILGLPADRDDGRTLPFSELKTG